MIAIQLLAILFALWMTYFTFLHFRRKEFTIVEFWVWQTLWLGLIIVVVYPKSVEFLLSTLKINRTFDLVVIVGIIVLFAATFRNTILLKRNQRKLEELVRKLSISKQQSPE